MRMNMDLVMIGIPFVLLSLAGDLSANPSSGGGSAGLTREADSSFAKIALKCVHREYPNKPEHVINDAGEVQGPRTLHPVFYGCFDWHSAVHGHWMLVRLLKMFPDLPEAGDIRQALGNNITADNAFVFPIRSLN